MIKLILDPGLFEIASTMTMEEQQEHYMILKNTIYFVSEFFESCIDSYNGAPYCYNGEEGKFDPPITKSLIIRNSYANIRKRLIKMQDQGKWIDLPVEKVECCSLRFEDTTVAETEFKRYLYYLINCDNEQNILVLLSQNNGSCGVNISVTSGKRNYELSAIFNPAVDCSGRVSMYLKKNDSDDDMFPQLLPCKNLNLSFQENALLRGQSQEEKKAYIKDLEGSAQIEIIIKKELIYQEKIQTMKSLPTKMGNIIFQ